MEESEVGHLVFSPRSNYHKSLRGKTVSIFCRSLGHAARGKWHESGIRKLAFGFFHLIRSREHDCVSWKPTDRARFGSPRGASRDPAPENRWSHTRHGDTGKPQSLRSTDTYNFMICLLSPWRSRNRTNNRSEKVHNSTSNGPRHDRGTK
jgi:hypothetical protein